MRKIKSPSTLISLTLLLFLNVISCSKKELTDKELFERYIAAPMPESVKNLVVDYSKGAIDGSCSFVFEITSNDFKKIFKSQNFKRTDFLNFKPPKPFSEWPDAEREIYFYKSTKRTEIYQIVTNKKHDSVYFLYTNY